MKASIFTLAVWALLALAGCSDKDSNATPNEAAARDAAPGPVSETTPPSTDEEGKQPPPQ